MEHVENHIIGHLESHSSATPQKPAFIFLEDGEAAERTITFGELNSRVQRLGSVLAEKQPQGQRALLVYQDIMEFTVSFLACQYAGLVAVPVFLSKGSKQVARFINLMEDAGVSLILSTSDLEAQVQQVLSGYLQTSGTELMATEAIAAGETARPRGNGKNEIAFIQYTSGSTGRPKGVVVTRGNLMHNEGLIQSTFGCDSNSVIFSWLPFHHDMGLIGNILHTIYVGCTCVLMSPYHFMQRPRRWLEGITKYKATHSGGPNFAYDFCLGKIPPAELEGLDLSSWKVAYNGSEPVRAETVERFSKYFEKAGFRKDTFYPCYGLAEATLLVSGGKEDRAIPTILHIEKEAGSRNGLLIGGAENSGAKPVVSSGRPAPETYIKIISLHNGSVCNELEEGEICIAGDSVTEGYWNKDNTSFFLEVDGTRYLRTGDLGFLHKGELFIHGRIKEMLIIRGENYYPYDIEHAAAENTRVIENNGVAIFTLDPGEEVVVVAEVKRSALKDLDAAAAITSIDKAVNGSFGINPHDIILTTPLGIPRTTSGKLQRVKCKETYRGGGFEVIASKKGLYRGGEEKDNGRLLEEVIGEGSYAAIRNYLLHLIEAKTGVQGEASADTMELTEMGIDSVRAMELINTINRDLNINMDATKVFQNNTLSGFINVIENLLWLKNEQNSGKSIVI